MYAVRDHSGALAKASGLPLEGPDLDRPGADLEQSSENRILLVSGT